MPVMNRGQWLVNDDSSVVEILDKFDKSIDKVADRYHFYFSYACPVSHRSLLLWSMLGLAKFISASSLDSCVHSCGWEFSDSYPDPLYHKKLLLELYRATKPDYSGYISLPLLWDIQTESIVCNVSENILFEWATKFGPALVNHDFGASDRKVMEYCRLLDLNICQKAIDVGYAKNQQQYQALCFELFEALEQIEQRLSNSAFVMGYQLTLADIYLFPILIRFDLVYLNLFNANLKSIGDFPNLVRYLKMMIAVKGVKETIKPDHIKQHYYCSSLYSRERTIVPLGPYIEYLQGL